MLSAAVSKSDGKKNSSQSRERITNILRKKKGLDYNSDYGIGSRKKKHQLDLDDCGDSSEISVRGARDSVRRQSRGIHKKSCERVQNRSQNINSATNVRKNIFLTQIEDKN